MDSESGVDAVRYYDPAAEGELVGLLRKPQHPPRIVLPDGTLAPQSDTRAFAPFLGACQASVFIDCVNEAETAQWTAAVANQEIIWSPPQALAVGGREFRFERGQFRAALPDVAATRAKEE